uniref:uncharacterized protein LOC117611421 n=1 Tax=Osmia lignaria TaxID=473952 RepID=UPI001478E431|nr:uncharacterized protein LOC117611421 [Osmia lignaria]XP_034195255.1 uncharacterized protein LOC117611421 [Osmia lignaria]
MHLRAKFDTQNFSGTSEICFVYHLLITKMGYNKFIASLIRSESTKALLKRRYNVSGIFYTSKCRASTSGRNDKNNELDELDKPLKFSTSEAARWPAAMVNYRPFRCTTVSTNSLAISLFIFYIYFTQLREENDIDLKMVENIPIEVQEQIYGKKEKNK